MKAAMPSSCAASLKFSCAPACWRGAFPRVVNLGTNAHGPYRTEWQGFWVELILPASLAGQNVTLQPAMVDSGWFRDDIRRQMEKRFYHQWLDGHWVAPGQAGQLPRESQGTRYRETMPIPVTIASVSGGLGSVTLTSQFWSWKSAIRRTWFKDRTGAVICFVWPSRTAPKRRKGKYAVQSGTVGRYGIEQRCLT